LYASRVREVLFVDTADFRLYNNAFILRRRIPYQDGFPVGEPEIVFKFRHPDIQKAAETDVRPQIQGLTSNPTMQPKMTSATLCNPRSMLAHVEGLARPAGCEV
jgi:hypothetical protein